MSSLTIEQIAELARSSRSTVSRVLNNHPSVKPAVRERVLRVINDHGYVPHAAARSLASQRTHSLGLLVPSTVAEIFADPFFGLVIQAITEASIRAGYFVMLCMVTGDHERGFYDRVLRSKLFDGMLMLSSHIDDPILPLLLKDNIPVVLLGSHPYFEDLTWVDADQREGSRAAITHLIATGHRRIATITGPMDMVASLDRRDGYQRAILEGGLSLDPALIVHGDWTRQSGFLAMQQLLALPERPTAVFAASDSMAIGALRAIHEAGLAVPGDIAVVGFDDLPQALYATPQLSSVRQPIAELGATAVKLLIDQVERGEGRGTHLILPTELVVRQSSDL